MRSPRGTRSIKGRGGSRLGAGAPTGNLNRQKGLVLPEPLNLESSESILTFMKTILIPSALTGSLGVPLLLR